MVAGRIVVAFMHFLIGLSGMAGGYAAISKPDGPFGISIAILKNGPFSSFLIPGIVLFTVIGIGNLAVGIMAIKKTSMHEYLIGMMSMITMGWIAVQVYMMAEINAMHMTIFLLGSVQAVFSLFLLIKGNKFPFNMI